MAASSNESQMSRFETKWLSRPENLAPLADVPDGDRQGAPAAIAEDHGAENGFERDRVAEKSLEARRALGLGRKNDPRIGLNAGIDDPERGFVERAVIGLGLAGNVFERRRHCGRSSRDRCT